MRKSPKRKTKKWGPVTATWTPHRLKRKHEKTICCRRSRKENPCKRKRETCSDTNKSPACQKATSSRKGGYDTGGLKKRAALRRTMSYVKPGLEGAKRNRWIGVLPPPQRTSFDTKGENRQVEDTGTCRDHRSNKGKSREEKKGKPFPLRQRRLCVAKTQGGNSGLDLGREDRGAVLGVQAPVLEGGGKIGCAEGKRGARREGQKKKTVPTEITITKMVRVLAISP